MTWAAVDLGLCLQWGAGTKPLVSGVRAKPQNPLKMTTFYWCIRKFLSLYSNFKLKSGTNINVAKYTTGEKTIESMAVWPRSRGFDTDVSVTRFRTMIYLLNCNCNTFKLPTQYTKATFFCQNLHTFGGIRWATSWLYMGHMRPTAVHYTSLSYILGNFHIVV